MCACGTEGNFMQYEDDGTVTRLRDDWTWPSYTEGTFFILSTVSGESRMNETGKKSRTNLRRLRAAWALCIDVEPIQNELVNCTTVWEKYKCDLETGAADPEKVLPQCIEELNAAGMDVIIEAQRQIDEYFGQ